MLINLWNEARKTYLLETSVMQRKIAFQIFPLQFLHSTKSWRGNIFIEVCSLSVCVSVCVSVYQWTNSNQTYSPIWMRFLLYCCLPYWLWSYWNWWPLVTGQGHHDVISIFSSLFIGNFPILDLSFVCLYFILIIIFKI